jgi:hypothetical protein
MGLVMAGSGLAKTGAGLIFSGLDTLWSSRFPGFDFVTQTACTTFSGYSGCYSHFYFINTRYTTWYYEVGINIRAGIASEYSMKMGKMNLDSVKSAPPDSILYKNPLGKIDSIPPDSLSSRIGNVYILKTATDPRPASNRPFYAKIKILKFIVIDSAQHSIKMVFLWTYNKSGYPDLTTSGLDTFHLDNTPTLTHDNSLSATHANRSLTSAVFKVATGKFTMPLALQGSNSFLAVYDLSGKQLGRVGAGNSRVIDLRQFGTGRGVVVVRVER